MSNSNSSPARLARNAAASCLSTCFGAGLSFVVTPLFLRYLGAERFGLWVLLSSIVAYTGLLELGLGVPLAKRVAGQIALNDRRALDELLGTALALFLAAAGLAMVAMAGAACLLEKIVTLSPPELHLARWCLLVLALNQGVSLLVSYESAVMFGAGCLGRTATVGAVVNGCTALANLALAMQGRGIVALAVATLVGTVTIALVMRRAIARRLPQAAFRLSDARWPMAKSLLKFGSRNSVISIAGAIAYGSDALLIALLLPIQNVAYYAIAGKLVNFVNTIVTKPVTVLLPAYSHLQALNDATRQRRYFVASVNISLLLCLPFVIALVFFGRPLLGAWVGSAADAVHPICAALAVAMLFKQPGYAGYTILTGLEKNSLLVPVAVASALVNLALSVVLTKQIGAAGPAVGSLITVAISELLVVPILTCRRCSFPVQSYLRDGLLVLFPPLVISLVAAAAWSIATARFGLQGVAAVLNAVAASAVVAFACWCCWFVVGAGAQRRKMFFNTALSAVGAA